MFYCFLKHHLILSLKVVLTQDTKKIAVIATVNIVSMAPVIDFMETVFLGVWMDSLEINAIKVYILKINSCY